MAQYARRSARRSARRKHKIILIYKRNPVPDSRGFQSRFYVVRTSIIILVGKYGNMQASRVTKEHTMEDHSE